MRLPKAITECEPVAPTPEQLADRIGRDDGIPAIPAAQWERRRLAAFRHEVQRAKQMGAHTHDPSTWHRSKSYRVRVWCNGDGPRVFPSMQVAAKELKLSPTTIRNMVLGGYALPNRPGLKVERA